MISVQMGDEKIRLSKIYVQLLQSGLHCVQTLFPVEPCIDNKIPVRRSNDIGIEEFERAVWQRNFHSKKVRLYLFDHNQFTFRAGLSEGALHLVFMLAFSSSMQLPLPFQASFQVPPVSPSLL
jgi:hypothetical protein